MVETEAPRAMHCEQDTPLRRGGPAGVPGEGSVPQMTAELLEWLASVADDPLAFALGAFPWGVPGTALEKHELDPWQIWVLTSIRDGLMTPDEAIQIAIASGHGVGKSALVAIIILGLHHLSRYPRCGDRQHRDAA